MKVGDTEIPQDIIDAARRVSIFFADRNIKDWQLDGCASRDERERMTLALRMVAEEFCVGDAGVLHSIHSRALMVVVGVLKELGEAETFDVIDPYGTGAVVFRGSRLKRHA